MFRVSIRELMLVTLVVGLGCVVSGCSWGSSRIRQGKSKPKPTALILSEKPSEARSQILKETPLGVPIDNAVNRLSSLGLASSANSPGDERIMRLQGGKNLVDVIWIVKMRGEEGKLADVSVEVVYRGP